MTGRDGLVRIASPELTLEGYAEQRGLPVEFLQRHGIHICPEGGERPGWIAIPYPHLTGMWYHRYRNPAPGPYGEGNPKYWAKAGSATHLHNPSRLGPNADLIVFTEGEFDCLALTYLGYPAIGLPGTGTTQRFQGNAAWKLLFDDTTVIAAFDGDEGGRTAAQRMVDMFSPRATSLSVPDGLDMNDWLQRDRVGLSAELDAVIRGMGAAWPSGS